MTEVGVAVVEDDMASDYTIVLENKKEITASNLRRQKRVEIKRFGNTVSYLGSKNELIDFKREMDGEYEVFE